MNIRYEYPKIMQLSDLKQGDIFFIQGHKGVYMKIGTGSVFNTIEVCAPSYLVFVIELETSVLDTMHKETGVTPLYGTLMLRKVEENDN